MLNSSQKSVVSLQTIDTIIRDLFRQLKLYGIYTTSTYIPSCLFKFWLSILRPNKKIDT